MSAYVHDNDHIDLIVSLAVRTEAYIQVADATARWGRKTVGLSTSHGQSVTERITPTALGCILLAENIASVRGRYDTVDDTPEGIEYDLAVSEYEHQPVSLDARTLGAQWAVAGIKALRSYVYQSCEHDGWHTSQAKQWADAITHHLFQFLDGYDDARTWSFTRPVPQTSDAHRSDLAAR